MTRGKITHPEKCKRCVQLCGRPHKDFNVEKVGKYTYICSKHFVGGAEPRAMYTDPIPAIQIGSSSVVKKARPPPHDRVTTTSTSESMTFEHNYASSSSSMDISFCDDDGETPSLADCCTQVSSTTL